MEAGCHPSFRNRDAHADSGHDGYAIVDDNYLGLRVVLVGCKANGGAHDGRPCVVGILLKHSDGRLKIEFALLSDEPRLCGLSTAQCLNYVRRTPRGAQRCRPARSLSFDPRPNEARLIHAACHGGQPKPDPVHEIPDDLGNAQSISVVEPAENSLAIEAFAQSYGFVHISSLSPALYPRSYP